MSIVKRVTEKETILIDFLRENDISDFMCFFDKILLENKNYSREFYESSYLNETYKILNNLKQKNNILDSKTKEFLLSEIKSKHNIVVKGRTRTGKTTILQEMQEFLKTNGYKTISFGEIKTKTNLNIEDIRISMQEDKSNLVLIVDETCTHLMHMISLIYAIENGIPTIFSIAVVDEYSNWKKVFKQHYYPNKPTTSLFPTLYDSIFTELYSYNDTETNEISFKLTKKEDF